MAEPIIPTHYEREWHPTATFGTFGTTATACSLLGLDQEVTHERLASLSTAPTVAEIVDELTVR